MSILKPVEKQRVAEEIVEQLRSLILTGQYPPGSKLPPERDLSKRLGVKEQAGTLVTAGSILVRQRGTHFHPGHNVGIGKDDTLFAKVAGKVAFERKGKYNRQISVYTAEEAM